MTRFTKYCPWKCLTDDLYWIFNIHFYELTEKYNEWMKEVVNEAHLNKIKVKNDEISPAERQHC